MSMNVKPIPTLDERINDIRMRTAEIVNEYILPNETVLWPAAAKARRPSTSFARRHELREEIKERVWKAGLWAPHLPREYGGMGLDFLAHAYMNEVLAYAVGAAALFGVVAPNSGNQTILVKYGTEEQKREVAVAPDRGNDGVGLLDDRAGQRRAPTPVARRPRAVLDGDQWVINGHKWFTSNGIDADFFIVMCRVERSGGREHDTGRMAQIIVPPNANGVNIVRGIGVWGRDELRPLRGRLRRRPGPEENALGHVGSGPPGRPGPARRRPHLPLHELGRTDVARLRSHGRARLRARGPRRAAEGQAVHPGLHRRLATSTSRPLG